VDTNIIIGFIEGRDNLLVNFIHNPDNKFFYTETVRKELTRSEIPKVFEYVPTTSSLNLRIDSAIADIKGIFSLKNNRHNNDIAILFEAGFVC
jgi:hypothetical protein